MGRYDGVLLCSDFDGTLCKKDKTISRENIEAIKYFQENGGLFTLASGRFSTVLDEIKEYFVPNTHAILLNGSQIFDVSTRKYIYEGTMPEDIFSFSFNIFNEIPLIKEMIFYTYNQFQTFTREDSDFEKFCNELPKPIFKMIFKVPNEHSDEITEIVYNATYGKYNCGRSWVNGIEIQSINDSKGLAVNRLRGILGSRAERVVCVGDYENDISMLKVADVAYAVDNAIASVKTVAHKVTVSNAEHAIAKIIEEL
jgi:Cof subfamily protein (haloacid dehalogenase superfamily)